VVRETDWSSLDSKANRIFKEKQSFDRLEVTKEDLRRMFSYSKYKLHYIDKLVTGEKSTVYRCGTLVDLCRGPHIQNTGKIKTFKIMQVCEGTGCKFCERNANMVYRTRLRTSSAIRAMIRCSVSVVLPSPTRS
jgi:threonyl-tRNA synthetase